MDMSDSDTDLLPNNVLTFQSQRNTISAKGPNISSSRFRNNNVMTSTMNMPWNMERPRYAESAYDQRSVYYRRERETSPISFHSASGMHMRNMHNSCYPRTMGSQRSIFERSGSPASVRTMDSNMSMSAKDIAFAFQNGTFNKFDFKIIRDAYNRFLKSRTRKRVEKRRNIRTFLKGFRRRSGGDSGDQASDSSISSDDCRSTRTSKSAIYKANMSSCRSTKTDISDFRKTMRESGMVRDCTENFRQNSFRSVMYSRPTKEKESLQKWQNSSVASSSSMAHSQNYRFRPAFLLPSQRFNHSAASLSISEKSNRLQRINEGNMLDICRSEPPSRRNSQDSDSDQEEIFADVTVVKNPSKCNNNNSKRVLEDDVPVPDKKRSKLSPKSKPMLKSPKQKQSNRVTKEKKYDFVFAKPQLPLKKPTIGKQAMFVTKFSQHSEEVLPAQKNQLASKTKSVEQPVEKILASSQKVVEKFISKSFVPLEPEQTITEKVPLDKFSQSIPQSLSNDLTLNSTTDLSMRPSFIKRKLFTQKVDVAEKNSSSDSVQAYSPQTNVYSKIQKEKNRARKLVTSQSCLNRDVQDDSNLLDLIHKIVPADRMNVTNTANKTEIQNNKSKPTVAEKWDLTSIVATCNNSEDVSDTFTDEDIFGAEKSDIPVKSKVITMNDENKNINKENKQAKNKETETKKKTDNEQPAAEKFAVKENKNNAKENQGITHCKAVSKQKVEGPSKSLKCMVQKLQVNKDSTNGALNISKSSNERNDYIKANMYKGVKSFWDTDAESDIDLIDIGKSKVIPEAPLQKNKIVHMPVLPQKKVKDILLKDATIQKINLSTITTQTERKPNRSMTSPEITKTMVEPIHNKVKSKKKYEPTENSKVIKKTLPVSTKENLSSEKVSKKTDYFTESELNKNSIGNRIALPVSTKENLPPEKESKKIDNIKSKSLNVSLKPKNSYRCNNSPKKIVKKTVGKAKTQTKNIFSSLNNNESQHITMNNTTLRIRAQRKPKIKGCCAELDTSHQKSNSSSTLGRSHRLREVDLSTSLKSNDSKQCPEPDTSHRESDNNRSLSRSLRSREIDLTTSLKSDDSSKKVPKKTAKPQKIATAETVACKNIGEKTLPSDVSFTLPTEHFDRTLRSKTISVNSKQQKSRKSDVSFILLENKTLDCTISTRSSRRNKELKSLLNSSASFYKTENVRPLYKKVIAESGAIKRSRSRRLLGIM